MSNTESKSVSVLSIPERTTQRATTRTKTVYTPGVDVIEDVKINGSTFKTYSKFTNARLIRVTARPQETRKSQRMVVAAMDIILDGLDVGIINEDGTRERHSLLTDPRWAQLREHYPYRIRAQQWMQVDDLNKLQSLLSHLQQSGFRVDLNPSNPKDSPRKTEDMFLARPIRNMDENDKTSYGVKLDGFELSINPTYPNGFSSFFRGLTEQLARCEDVYNETDEEMKEKRVEMLVRNAHFVSGVFQDANNQTWPRPADVGVIDMNGRSFPLYSVDGASITEDSLLDAFNKVLPQSASDHAGSNVTAAPALDISPDLSKMKADF